MTVRDFTRLRRPFAASRDRVLASGQKGAQAGWLKEAGRSALNGAHTLAERIVETWRRGHQAERVAVAWFVKQIAGRAYLDDLARAYTQAIGGLLPQSLRVGARPI